MEEEVEGTPFTQENNNKNNKNQGDVLTGRKNKFCARRIAAWLLVAEKLMLDALAVGRIVSSESLRKNCKENVASVNQCKEE